MRIFTSGRDLFQRRFYFLSSEPSCSRLMACWFLKLSASEKPGMNMFTLLMVEWLMSTDTQYVTLAESWLPDEFDLLLISKQAECGDDSTGLDRQEMVIRRG